jgi:biotin operon repressor
MPFQVRDNRGGNWFWLHNAILDSYGPRLGVYALSVYVALCRHAGQDQQTWVSQGKLAASLGAGRTSVNQAIAKLRDLGLIEVEDRTDSHGRTTSIYTLGAVTPVCDANSRITPAEMPIPAERTAYRNKNKTHGNNDRFTPEDYLRHRNVADWQDRLPED